MAFDNIPYDVWLSKIQKELRVETLEKHHVLLDNGLKTDPFFERITTDKQGLRVEQTWKIRQVFDGNDLSNSKLITSLERGVNYVEIQDAESLADLTDLFQGIFFDFIHLHLVFSERSTQEMVDSVIKSISKLGVSHLSFHIESKSKHADACMRIVIIQGDSLVDDITNGFNKIIAYIDNSTDKTDIIQKAKSIQLERFLSSDIIREIAIFKAIEILWQNILNGFELEPIELQSLASCHADENLDLDNKYISLSSKGLTASVAGYKSIYIERASADKANFHDRISTNIHHLLQSESFIQKSHKGFGGSYQIHRIAQEIATTCWKNIGRD